MSPDTRPLSHGGAIGPLARRCHCTLKHSACSVSSKISNCSSLAWTWRSAAAHSGLRVQRHGHVWTSVQRSSARCTPIFELHTMFSYVSVNAAGVRGVLLTDERSHPFNLLGWAFDAFPSRCQISNTPPPPPSCLGSLFSMTYSVARTLVLVLAPSLAP